MNDMKTLAWLAAVFGAGWLLYLLAPILTPFVIAALLAYVGDPLVDRLQGLRVPRTPAVLLVMLLGIVALGLLILLIGPLAKTQVQALIDRLPGYVVWVEQKILPNVMEFVRSESGQDEVGLAPLLSEYGSMVGDWGAKLLGTLTRSGSALVAGILSLFLVPVLVFYLLRDWDHVVAGIGEMVPLKHQGRVFQLARESDSVLGAFLRGQLLVMLGLAVIYTSGLLILGIPYALAIGVVAGLVSFVPYLGFVIGIGLAGLAAVVEPNGLLLLVGVVAVFSIAQAIEGMLLTPRLVGDRIGLHPVLVIFSVLAGGQLFGFFGILLALPVAAVLSVWVRFAILHVRPPETIEADDTPPTG